MAASPFTRVSPFLSDSQSPLLPFRICPSNPRPRVLCCVQSWALYKVPPPLQEALYKVRGAQGQGRIPRPVFPAVQAIRTSHLRRHTGCPWHFAKSRISNVGVNVNINVNNNLAVNINVNTPFKPSRLPNQRRRWSFVAYFTKMEIPNFRVQT